MTARPEIETRFAKAKAPLRISTLLATLILAACGGGSDGGGGFIPPIAGGGGGGGNPTNPGNPDPGTPPAGATLKVGVLSSPPQLVTGDDALVELELLSEQSPWQPPPSG